MKSLLDSLSKQLAKVGIGSGLLLPVISLALLVGVITLVLMPQFPEVFSIYTTLTQEQQKQVTLQNKVSKLEGINKDTYKNDLIELTKLLPNTEDYSGLVHGVTRFARSNALTVDDIKIDLQTKSADHVRFQIDVRGKLEAISTFLEKAKSVKRMYVPENYELRRSDGAEQEYVANLTLQAPFKAPPEVLGEATSSVKEYTDEEKKILSEVRQFSSYSLTEAEETTVPSTKSNPFAN